MYVCSIQKTGNKKRLCCHSSQNINMRNLTLQATTSSDSQATQIARGALSDFTWPRWLLPVPSRDSVVQIWFPQHVWANTGCPLEEKNARHSKAPKDWQPLNRGPKQSLYYRHNTNTIPKILSCCSVKAPLRLLHLFFTKRNAQISLKHMIGI